jgi:hypothetical protein
MRFMFILLPSCFPIVGGPAGVSGTQIGRPRGLPLANHDPSALMMAREGVVASDLHDPGRSHAAPLPLWLPYTRPLALPNNIFAIGPYQDNCPGNVRKIETTRGLKPGPSSDLLHVSGLALAEFKHGDPVWH